MLNTENGSHLKIQKLKRKLCLARALVYEPRSRECTEPRNLLFSFVLFARAGDAVGKRDERVCGIPAESGHPPADQGNDPADRTYIMQRTIATLEIRFSRLRLSQGVVGQAFPGHLKSKAPPGTMDGGSDAGSVNYQNLG